MLFDTKRMSRFAPYALQANRPTKHTYNKKKTAKMPTGPAESGTVVKTIARSVPAIKVPRVIAFANIFHIVA